ncbi:enolase C-terminal domain-like protein [Frigidibacter sp. MR17.14]|uniref:mandelate racemase/muconate lactonizing enzyme family protein n=1 Tax=Frigidibacter sp. MR17.14 TaxID=3126509 RepID=UPI003012CBF7
MIVTSASSFLVRVPLSAPYVISRGALDAFVNVVLRLESDEGVVGWGEAVPVSLTEDPAEFKRVIDECLLPALLGQTIDSVADTVDALLPLCEGHVATVAAVDLALWDMLGKARGVSVGQLLDGEPGRRTLIDYTMGALAPAEMAARALEVCEAGYSGVVVKITCKDLDEDLARVRAVCTALPTGRSIRVDANAGFDRDTARRFLDSIAGLPIEFLEQPVAAGDLAGMRACRDCGVPIAADESLKVPGDALALVTEGACDVLNVKVTKAGGIAQSLRVARIAEAAGLPLVIGGGLTFGPSRFASQHIAAATPATRGIAHQGPGPASQALTGDITLPRLTPALMRETAGTVTAPATPGLGFRIDAAALDRFRIA